MGAHVDSLSLTTVVAISLVASMHVAPQPGTPPLGYRPVSRHCVACTGGLLDLFTYRLAAKPPTLPSASAVVSASSGVA